MFENKNFQSWFKENTPKEGLSETTTFSKQFVKDAWDNGYYVGYNKANEWHYVEDGDLPKEDLDRSYWEGFDNAKNKMEKRIEELEKQISILLSCNNCPDNKGGLLCQKEYEDKCLAQKIQYIKELKEENAELNDKLNNLSKVAEVRLANWQKYEEENIKLKAQIEKMKDCLNKWYKQHNDDDYTETFYDNLLRDTEKCLWGDSVND